MFWIGAISLACGLFAFAIAVPRKGEDVRPFMNNEWMRLVYPPACLTLIAMGAATLVFGR